MESAEKPVLVLGAGINGCAIARELILNNVPVCVVDTADPARGATSGSSRLIHGGLRYLEYGEFDLVKESLGERTRLLRLAPQFVRPLRLWIPAENRFGGAIPAVGKFFGWRWWPQPKRSRGSALVRAGLWFYDAYAQDATLPKHTCGSIQADGAPRFAQAKYHRLCSYYDGQVSFPERLVLSMLEDARAMAAERGLGFRVLTYHEARLNGKTVEITPCEGVASPQAGEIEPSLIVNATGAWVDETLQSLRVDSRRLIGGTKGSHFFSFNPRLLEELQGQGVYAEANDGRPIFITPLDQTVLIGTTDIAYEGPPQNARATERELDYLLASVNEILPGVRLEARDIDFHYCAVRPLPYSDAATNAAITRRHSFVDHTNLGVPMISVVGGKLTTMRSLAEQATADVLEHLGRTPTATSQDRPFPGAENYPSGAEAVLAEQQRIAERTGFTLAGVAETWKLCGTRCEAILSEAADRELLPGTDLPTAMARWSIAHEHPRTLADLVERRLVLLYHQRLTAACLRRLAALLAEAGHLAPEEIDQAASAESDRLQTRYGKTVS